MRRPALWLVALGLAARAAAGAAHAPAPDDAVRWLAPADGAVLPAGGRVELAWEPGPGFGPAAAIEEWEVFLSVDAGRSWPVRLTPHLSIGVRRLPVALPPLVSDRVRLLLRYGDERTEFEWEVPVGLRLARSGSLAVGFPLPSPRPGEVARPGLPGVALFSVGPRDGAGARWMHASPTAGWAGGARWTPSLLGWPIAPPERRPEAFAAAGRGIPARRFDSSPSRPEGTAEPAPSLPPLLATCRRNE